MYPARAESTEALSSFWANKDPYTSSDQSPTATNCVFSAAAPNERV